MRRFHRGYLLTGLLLTGLVVLASLQLFPEWSDGTRSTIILLVMAIGGTATFLVSSRQALENPPLAPLARREVAGGPILTAGCAVAGSDKTTTFDEREQAAKIQFDIAGDFIEGAAPGRSPLHQLRAPAAGFTGRELEIVQLLTAFQPGHAAIAGIDGMAGVGKTELAYAVAQRLADTFPDAQLVVDMRGAPDTPHTPASAMALIVNAFQPELRLPDDLDQLQPYYHSLLKNKRVLLLLDNAVDAAQVQPLLPPAGCGLLVTSRQRIDLPGIGRAGLDALPMPKACELLIELIGPQRATAQQFTRLARLCGRLPLALRAAGSFLAVHQDWAIGDFIETFSDEHARLSQLGHEDLDVEAALTLSYAQLQRDDAALARRWLSLSVFPAPFTWQAAGFVWELPENDTTTARELLSRLVERGLLIHDPTPDRYRLHDVARLFADAQLSDEERRAIQLRHAAYYLHVLRATSELYLRDSAGVLEGLALFDVERVNIEAGERFARALAEADEGAARLSSSYAGSGVYCLDVRQHPREKISWLEAAITAARRLEDKPAEGRHLGNLGIAYADLDKARRAMEFYEQALVIAREVGDRRGEGNTLFNMSLALDSLGERDRAVPLAEAALDLFEQMEDSSAAMVRRRLAKWRGR